MIAINSPNNIDPLLQTGCFSSVVSSSTNTIAPAPHGPGLLRHEPSVNAIAVLSVVSVIFHRSYNAFPSPILYNPFVNQKWLLQVFRRNPEEKFYRFQELSPLYITTSY